VPRIGETLGILFYVYAEDHNPPHVHAIYGSEQAQLVIASGALLAGSLPGSKLRQAQDWLAANRAVAQAAWARLNP
jgi:acyl dehydratase